MSIDRKKLKWIRAVNLLHTGLIMLALVSLVAILGYWLFGADIAFLMLFTLVAILVLGSFDASAILLRSYRAQAIARGQAPDLYHVLDLLSERAGLSTPPTLYYLPYFSMTAFASGNSDKSVIALSDGLMRQLNFDDVIGVLAHEISHIRHGDLKIMVMADILGHLARLLCTLGFFALLLFFPLILLGMIQLSLWPVFLMICSPVLSALLQLALSRNREFLADISAAQLMGNPQPLISALVKLDDQNVMWERYLSLARESQLLRTHPTTQERIKLLHSVELVPQWQPLNTEGQFQPHWQRVDRRKRHLPNWWP